MDIVNNTARRAGQGDVTFVNDDTDVTKDTEQKIVGNSGRVREEAGLRHDLFLPSYCLHELYTVSYR